MSAGTYSGICPGGGLKFVSLSRGGEAQHTLGPETPPKINRFHWSSYLSEINCSIKENSFQLFLVF